MIHVEDLGGFLEDCKKRGVLIGFHCKYQKDGNFHAGFLEEIEEHRFHVRYVNRGGLPGTKADRAWFRFDEVIWVRIESDYLNGVSALSEVSDQHSDLKESRWKTNPKSIKKALKECLEKSEVCRIRYSDFSKDDVFVKDIGEFAAHFRVLGEDASPDGEILLLLEELTGVKSGGLHEHTMTYLAKRLAEKST